MHVAIVSVGTRGDCQPYVALAKAISERGHQVTIICNKSHEGLFDLSGTAQFVGLDQNIDAFMRSKEFVDILMSRDVFSMMNSVRHLMEENWTKNAETTLNSSRSADVLVSNLSCWTYATSIAEELSIPLVMCPLIPPAFVTGAFPPVLMCPYPLPSWIPSWLRSQLTKLMYHFLYVIFDTTVGNKEEIQRFRQTLRNVEDLQVHKSAKRLLFRNMFSTMVLGYSHTLAPIPVDDWFEFDVHPAGFFRIKDGINHKEVSKCEETERELIKTWINNDKSRRPVFVGFGSMYLKDDKKLELLLGISKVAQKLNLRLIIQRGAMNLNLDDAVNSSSSEMRDYFNRNSRVIGSISHEWLFPLCKTIVHHGGAGTTATAMLSGVPQLVIPFGFDQQYWAWRTVDMKLSPGYCRHVLDLNEELLYKLFYEIELQYSSLLAQSKTVQKQSNEERDAATKGALVIEQVVLRSEGYWDILRRKQREHEQSANGNKKCFIYCTLGIAALILGLSSRK